MEGRIVASFRAIGGPGRPFLDRARSLIERLTALGGVHVGWDALKITFAFDASSFAEVLEAAITRGIETQGDEPSWAVGLAQGDLRRVEDDSSPLTQSGLLWWGPPIVAASALAALAKPGEIFCAQTVPAVRNGDIVTSGLRIARDGTLRVRGARVDTAQPWRQQAIENLRRMTEPRLVTSHLPAIDVTPGSLVILRADPGAGGTRLLLEISRSSRALLISPVGSGFEPFGSLRRALGRSIGREVGPLLLELAAPLEQLLSGRGVTLDMASRLIAAFLWSKEAGVKGAILVDDARFVDPATLEAVVRAVRKTPSLGVIARLDATGGLPSMLAGLPKAGESELGALTREGVESIAFDCTGGALDQLACARWGRLGGQSPLAVIEAVAQGIANGELTFTGDRAKPRSRAAGRGIARPAASWIRQRANAERAPVRAALSLLAVLGGEARTSFLTSVLETSGLRIDAASTIAYLQRSRWVVSEQQGYVSFPSRTHGDALFTALEDDAKNKLHLAIARSIVPETGADPGGGHAIDEEEGVFGRVESAWHSAQAGDGVRASAMLLEAAKATAEAFLEASTTQLIAFARRVDPTCEEAALELLANALARSPSVPPPPRASVPPVTAPVGSSKYGPPAVSAAVSEPDSLIEHARIAPAPPPMPVLPQAAPPDSEPPTLATGEAGERNATEPMALPLAPPQQPHASPEPPPLMAGSTPPVSNDASVPPSNAPGSQIAVRLGELAKEALLAADNAALERWVDGLRAAGEDPAFTERMRAMARLGRGEIGDALRVLRRTRARLDPKDHRRRCQTSLALGVALGVAGRPQEALLEGMDALARARHTNDDRGAKACLAFLAKLYTSVARDEEAERLRRQSA